MMWFVCYKYHRYFVCLARDAFARLEALVPSIVHQRTANILQIMALIIILGIKQILTKPTHIIKAYFYKLHCFIKKGTYVFSLYQHSATTFFALWNAMK